MTRRFTLQLVPRPTPTVERPGDPRHGHHLVCPGQCGAEPVVVRTEADCNAQVIHSTNGPIGTINGPTWLTIYAECDICKVELTYQCKEGDRPSLTEWTMPKDEPRHIGQKR